MKYTYDIKNQNGATLVVAYTPESSMFQAVEKTVALQNGETEVQAVVREAPIREWMLSRPDLFPPKPPGTPSEFKVDTTQQPPQGAPV